MDILDRLLYHDARTNLYLLSRCAELTEAQLRLPGDVLSWERRARDT